MLFNSSAFIVFFIAVFALYWLAQDRQKIQNWVLLLASYFFYGYASWKMLPLLLISTFVFYYIGRGIYRTENEKTASRLTTLGVVAGLGLLVYFKYLNFFIDEFAQLLSSFGLQTNIHSFGIVMPIGISFFTFRLISYILDIHHGKYKPTEDLVTFATYVAFFPCIMSGPIDRPKFMGQLTTGRTFSYDNAVDGCRQILWGLFKKVVIADNCATFVDQVWGHIDTSTGSTLLLAATLYLFQIYADFSGYSDMAIGIGKMLNLKIADNFKSPLFALNVADYWRRWHITLTTWLTDYVFMPLNLRFRDWGQWGLIAAILINFLLIGAWHGDNWTFVLFGLYHGLLYIPLILSGAFYKKSKLKTFEKVDLPVPADFGRIVLTMFLVIMGLILFRADNLVQAAEYVKGMVQFGTVRSLYRFFTQSDMWPYNAYVIGLLVWEWVMHNRKHGLDISAVSHPAVRVCIYYVLIFLIVLCSGHNETYIYFRF